MPFNSNFYDSLEYDSKDLENFVIIGLITNIWTEYLPLQERSVNG